MNEKKLVSGLVSIAIPAYKKKWLKEAIVSALSQDYPNIEVITCNIPIRSTNT